MLKKIFLFSITTFLLSCGSDTATENPTETATTTDTIATEPVNELADFKFHTLVINIESPFEIVALLPKSGLTYKNTLVNSTENEKKYATSAKKGLNYGVYIVDLVYLSSNEQFSDVKNYFQTSRNIAKSLDCAESFDNIAGSRLEKNIDNKDTINKVVDQIYTEMDSYLRSNDRLLTASQILVGSWIESQYITVSLIKDQTKNKENEMLFNKVNTQGFAIEKLIELLKEFENEKELKAIVSGLKTLEAIYKENKTEDIEKQPVLNKIHEQLSALRTKIVN